MADIASICLRLGMHQDAIVLQKNVLQLYRHSVSDNHPDTCECHSFRSSILIYLLNKGIAMEALAYTYHTLHRHQDALELQDKVLKIRSRILPARHPRIGAAFLRLILICSDKMVYYFLQAMP